MNKPLSRRTYLLSLYSIQRIGLASINTVSINNNNNNDSVRNYCFVIIATESFTLLLKSLETQATRIRRRKNKEKQQLTRRRQSQVKADLSKTAPDLRQREMRGMSFDAAMDKKKLVDLSPWSLYL